MTTLLEVLGDRLLATSVQTVLLTALVWLLCRCVRRLPAGHLTFQAVSLHVSPPCPRPIAH